MPKRKMKEEEENVTDNNKTCWDLHVKCLIFLLYFNCPWIVLTNLPNIKFRRNPPSGSHTAICGQMDGWMDGHEEWMNEKWIGTFCDHTKVPNKCFFLLCSLTYSQDAQHLYASAADGSVVIWEGGGGTGSKGMSKTPKFLNLTSLWGMLKWLRSRIDVVIVGIVDPEFGRNVCYISLFDIVILSTHYIYYCHRFHQNLAHPRDH
jgi:hypothetical protein